eukprot:m.75929 g.75929  ORF g.75929 m.75929 type:complete len:152 (-) comp50423_c0_seq3:15-470(-)
MCATSTSGHFHNQSPGSWVHLVWVCLSEFTTTFRNPANRRLHFDMLISNPPYIPSRFLPTLQPEVRLFESALALDGGPDGLSIVRTILAKARQWVRPAGFIWLEVDGGHPSMIERMVPKFEGLAIVSKQQDLRGVERFCQLLVADTTERTC